MIKISIGILFLFFCLSQSITVKQYGDTSCSTLVATMPITLDTCIDTSSGSSQSSMVYKVCNQTNVIIQGYTNNNCGGTSIFSLYSSPGICQNQMIIICDGPTPPGPVPGPAPSPSQNSNGWIVTIKSFNENNCQTLIDTMTATVGTCKVFPTGQSSGMFLFCNSSIVSGNMYANNNCGGNPITYLSSPTDQCFNREIVTCIAPPKNSSSNLIIYTSTFLLTLNFLLLFL